MFTLADAQKLSQSKLLNGVIDEFRRSPILDLIPFDDTVKPQGGETMAYTYNRVTTMATAATRALGAEYVPQEEKTTQYTVNLKVFGGSYQIDRVVAKHEKQAIDLVKRQTDAKTQAAIALFNEMFISGDSGVDSTEFDGIVPAVTGSSTEVTPSSAYDLSDSTAMDSNYKAFMDALDNFLALLDGDPSALLMNKILRAKFNGIARRSESFTHSEDAFGRPVLNYAGIPLVSMGDKPGTSNPIMEIDGVTGETDLVAVRFGVDGVHAVSPEGDIPVSVYLPDFTRPGAVKTGEVEMIGAVALKKTRAAGVMHKIKVN